MSENPAVEALLMFSGYLGLVFAGAAVGGPVGMVAAALGLPALADLEKKKREEARREEARRSAESAAQSERNRQRQAARQA